MKYGMIEVDWKYIGAQMAHSDDHAQADFFNAFAEELRAVCVTVYAAEMQMASVDKEIKADTRSLFTMIGERI